MLLRVGLNLVVETFHDGLETFGERLVGDSGAFELLHALAQFVDFVGHRHPAGRGVQDSRVDR
jgi:hypothetical protein